MPVFKFLAVDLELLFSPLNFQELFEHFLQDYLYQLTKYFGLINCNSRNNYNDGDVLVTPGILMMKDSKEMQKKAFLFNSQLTFTCSKLTVTYAKI